MDITTVLAQLWGPIMFAIGLGIFVSKSFYIKMYRDLEKAPLAVLTFGMLAMAAGIAQVSVHNIWGTVPQIIVTLLGWGALVKGTVFIIAPRLADRGGDWAADSKLISFVGTAMIILGGYISWFAYFA